MADWLERTELIMGKAKLEKLAKSHVLIIGLGGIGSFAAEFVGRAGVGKLTLIDGDNFDATNKNRQLTALDTTIGRNKADVLAERLLDINPEIQLVLIKEFVVPERVWEILGADRPDYVMDCIDSVTPKLEWILACKRLKIKIITHLGAGGKVDTSKVLVDKLENVNNCKLGLVIKKRMKNKKASFRGIKAVFSTEIQQKHSLKMTDGTKFKKSFYGTVSYIPALFGLYGAAEVINHLAENKQ
jgi:tRNA A37 threonylcarbamoyladenosine dehydratase